MQALLPEHPLSLLVQLPSHTLPSEQIRHSPMTRIPHQPRILRQHTPRNRHTRLFPFRQSPLNLLILQMHIDSILLGINRDDVPILDNGDGPTDSGFRTYMPDDEAVRGARVAAVCYESHVCELSAHYCGGGFELFGHAWACGAC
jgi:hypothetical protein